MADVKYVVTVDSTGAQKSIETLEQALAKMKGQTESAATSQKTLTKTTQESGGAMGFLTATAGKLIPPLIAADLAADAIKKTFGFLKDQILDAVKAASEEERIDRSLASALAMTGRAAEGTGGHFSRLAEAIESETIYAHDAVKKTQTLLIQLTSLDREGLDKATKGAIGLASVLGIDLDTAARTVTKAMEGNYTALQRYGIKVSESLSGDEKRAAMMDKLLGFYKRSQDEATTYSGRIEQLKNAYEKLLETLGDFIVKNPEIIKAMEGVKSIVEWLAIWIPQNTKLIEQLSDLIPGVRGLKDVLHLLGAVGDEAAKEVKKFNDQMEAGQKNAEELWKVMVKNADQMNLFGLKLGPIINYLDRLAKNKPGAMTELEKLFETLGMKTIPTMKTELENAEKALALFKAQGGTAIGVIEPLEKRIRDLRDALRGIKPIAAGDIIDAGSFKDETLFKALPEQMKTMGRVVGGELGRLIDSVEADDGQLLASITRNTTGVIYQYQRRAQALAKFAATMETIKAKADYIFQAMDVTFEQAQKNREIAIENEYKKRLALINNTVKDETKKQAAIVALEAEFEIKRTSAKRAAAKQEKAVAMMEAVVNTAAGVTKALAQGGFLLGIPWAAIVGALGAVQIAMIAKQPIPLAKGAMFTKPTLLPARYEVAEAGEAEFVLPESKLRAVFKDVAERMFPPAAPAYALAGAGGGAVTVNINSPLIHTIGLSQSDLERAGDRMYQVIERQLRRRGRT